MKIKVGSPELACDVERLTRVREAVGPAVEVMIDLNLLFQPALSLAGTSREDGACCERPAA